ncbi:phospholipase D family protein [Halomonas sp. TRM85114]|uniref:phospholipase D family protein n=1 Tax=Halomonas jincaotanensis TaxID=2810616 RepID=UPI001BD32A27|nr:phospholipase D family protein [Halomonas jincaotanensis]MBS9404940.1 phospholipase D family protein [Halomonas jincaotanensis]
MTATERSSDLWRVLLCCLLALTAGCTTHPVTREHTTALRPAEIEATALGSWTREASRGEGGDSGFALLADGEDAFAVRARLADEAERRLDIQAYLIDEGQTTRALLRRMLAAAERGVEVRLLLDDLSAVGQNERLAALDSHPRIQVRVFNTVAIGRGHLASWVLAAAPEVRRTHRRMHNKLWITDNAVAITGGRNLADEYFNAGETRNFADLDLLAVGPVVDALSLSFDLYWNHGLAQPIGRYHRAEAGVWRHLHDTVGAWQAELLTSETRLADQKVAAKEVLSAVLHWGKGEAFWDPPRKIRTPGRPPIEMTLVGALRERVMPLDSRLVIMTAYFLPMERGTQLLVGLAESGIQIDVITNALSASDMPWVHGDYAARRPILLASGVRLFEMRAVQDEPHHGPAGLSGSPAAALHIKALGFDDDQVFVGSFNVDPRSLWWNTETGVLVESESLSADFHALAEIGRTPALSYEVRLDDSDELVWETQIDGERVRIEREPGSRWQHFSAWLSRLLGLAPWL